MKKGILRLAAALIITLVLITSIAVPAFAAKPDTGKDAVYKAIAAGGNRLLSLQGTSSGTIPYNWEWVAGDGYYGSDNLQGVTASGLLAAYEKTGNKALLTGARNAGDTLKQRFAAAPTQRPYSQDVEFLVNLAKDTGNKSYLDTAKKWYAVLMQNFTAEANVDRNIKARGSLAGWDLASAIRAADATGNEKYALDMAKELIRRSADWVDVPYPGTTDDYTTLSYGSMLWALDDVRGGNFHATIDKYRDFLLANQQQDGSWLGDYQTTAYVILGLDAVKGEGKDLRDAISSASDYLVTNQNALGGWDNYFTSTYFEEYPEVDAECLMALASPGAQEYGRFDHNHWQDNNHHDTHHGGWGHGPRK